MTPQRWKGAGVVCLAIAGLLIVAALLSVLLTATPGPVTLSELSPYQSNVVSTFGLTGVLRGVVLGAFAGVFFFLGLSCFAWSALTEAGQQRAEMLDVLTALRAHAEKAG